MALKTDILFFGSHPDDVELSCGGTILNYTSSGIKIRIIDLTLGELGTRGTVQLRQKEASQAAKVLGALSRENLKIKDGDIENTSSNRLKVIRVIRKYKPEVIFLPYPSDRHPDHINASTLIRESAFYSGLEKIHTKLNGVNQKHHRPSKLIYYMQTYPFEPSFIVDISNFWEIKKKAISAYESQIKNINPGQPYPLLEKCEIISRYFGCNINALYGEPFISNDSLNMDPF